MMTPKIDIDQLVTVPQAARLLKISSAAIRKALKRGRIPFLKIGRAFLIKRAHLKAYRKSKSLGGRPKKHIQKKRVAKSGQVL